MADTTDAVEGITRYGETLDTRLIGTEYLLSDQKYRLDQVGARMLATTMRPIVAAARLALYLEDGGPTLIKLPRVGKAGVQFQEYKLRSMVVGSENDPVIVGSKLVKDPRATHIGTLLRSLSIDELPQARNILEGSMSLVGTRPKALEEISTYRVMDEGFYDAYVSMRPGLTGLEQIKGRGAATSKERIELTKEYAAEASLRLDLDIIRRTIGVVAMRRGAY